MKKNLRLRIALCESSNMQAESSQCEKCEVGSSRILIYFKQCELNTCKYSNIQIMQAITGIIWMCCVSNSNIVSNGSCNI